ncbi:uncharacterized protein LOC112847815 [Oreochromis niloticus]|uniref:uncharacterized protein LOC112847815 n=1 Tax=Oreochromis niloticus TaxID=8128 RepID=UPI000DF1FC80|nr:uncharacterized protein LOC112847815 [Oreochromis niloticus]CAI5673953.1 unnamed protein product [Mustela putorius furo]
METANKNAQDLQTSGATAKCFILTKGQQDSRTFKGESKECYCCKGIKHIAADCKYKQEKCHACGKVGHIARACRSKTKLNQKRYGLTYVKSDKKQSSYYSTHNVGEKADNSKTDSFEDDSFTLNCVKRSQGHKRKLFKFGHGSVVHLRKVDPYTVDMQIDGKKVNFEIDTGCCLTLMNKATEKQGKTPSPHSLQPIKIKLETYTGDPVMVIGATQVRVEYKQQEKHLPLVVAPAC